MKAKKIIYVLFALIMVLGMVTFAYAADGEIENECIHRLYVSKNEKRPTEVAPGWTAEYSCVICGEVVIPSKELDILPSTYGKCGDNLRWVFDPETREISINGNGEMWDYDNREREWDHFRDIIYGVCHGYNTSNDLKSIGKNAFYKYYSIDHINLPTTIKKISENAFAYCTNLKKVSIYGSNIEIEKNAFYGCDRLEEVDLGSVVKIGENAFKSFMLKKITIPSTVEEIAENAFNNPIYNLKQIKNCSKTVVASNISGEYYVDEETADMASFWYAGLNDIEIKKESSDIRQEQKDRLVDVLLNQFNKEFEMSYNNAEEVESFFDNAEKANGIPNYLSIECYRDSAQHRECIEKGINHTLIDDVCDPECGKRHKGIYIDGKCTKCNDEIIITDDLLNGQCGDNAYWSYDQSSETLTISGSGDMWDIGTPEEENLNGEYDRGWHLFTLKINNIVIGDEITRIGNNAFSLLVSAESVKIGRSVTEIGKNAFSGLMIIKKIEVPKNVKVIEDYAFGDSLCAEIVLNEGLEIIGDEVFQFIGGHKRITIPSTVKEIGVKNFICFSDGSSISNKSSSVVLNMDYADWYRYSPAEEYEQMCFLYEYLYSDIDENIFVDNYDYEEDFLNAVNAKFGTSYENIYEFYEYTEGKNVDGIDALSYVNIECFDNSAQHEQCKTLSINHSIIGSMCDDACGVHDIYENEYIKPTCTENGYIGGKVCIDCEKVFETPEIIKPLGHKAVTLPGVQPTCTEIGFSDSVVCEACGEALSDVRLIQATGHTDADKNGICDSCGEIYDDFEPEPIPDSLGSRVINFFKGIVDAIIALFRKIFG